MFSIFSISYSLTFIFVALDHWSALIFASLRSETEKQAAAAAVLIVFTSILLWLIELIAFVDTVVNCHEYLT